MSMLRKLVLAAATLTALMAFMTPSSSAVTVSQEPSAACPATGCEVHLNSISQVELGSPLGMINCNSELQANINAAGVGHNYQKTLTNCTPIPFVPCGPEWPINMSETSLAFDLCIEILDIPLVCHIDLNIFESGHSYTFTTGGGHRICENDASLSVHGAWVTEGTNIELVD